MKHPVLARVFAIVLAVLCIVMLLAGVFGLRSAARDRQRAMEDAGRLRDRAASYTAALAALEGGTPYTEANDTLQRHQAEHDKLASRHRSEMAMYTATQSGLRSGTFAMDQADAAFAEGKKQYEAGLAEFNKQAAAFDEQYRQFQEGKQQLQNFTALYDAAAGLLQNAWYHSQNAHAIADLMDSEDPEARRQLTLSSYDGLLAAADQSAALLQTVKDLTPTLDAIAAMDAGSLDSLSQLSQMGDFGGGDVDMPEIDPEQVRQIKEVYDAVWPQVRELVNQMDTLLPAVDSAAQEATGMSLAELRAQAQAQRDAIAAGEAEDPMTDEQFEIVRAAYNLNRGLIQSVQTSADGILSQLQGISDQIGGVLGTAQSQLAQAEPLLEQGKAAIEQGRAGLVEAGKQIEVGEKALYDARAMIWWQMGQQREKAARLQYEKERLETEAAQLKELEQAVEARKELEQEERSLRLLLLKRDAVADRNEAGVELTEAARLSAQEVEDEASYQWQGRRLAYSLLIAAGVLGFLGIPAAFEKTKSRFWLIAPVLLCLLCACGAEYVCLKLGRGSSYSAIGGVLFALIHLLAATPRVKKPKATT